MIQPMGKRPKAAPWKAAARAASAGIPTIPTAIARAVDRPAPAAAWADQPAPANSPSKATSGSVATSVESSGEESGS